MRAPDIDNIIIVEDESELPYSAHREGRLILVLLAISLAAILFISLDDIFGAVGLKPIYYWFGFIVGGAFLLAWLVLFIQYRIAPAWILTPGCLIAVVLCACLTLSVGNPFFILVFGGWVALTVSFCIPMPLVAAVLALMIWFTFMHVRDGTHKPGYGLTTFALPLFMAVYIIGLGARLDRSEFHAHASLSASSRHYFLYEYWGWLGDDDTLVLYECNPFAFNCNPVYELADEFAGQKIALRQSSDQKGVEIWIDGVHHHTHEAGD
jgi:hypothetical protein